MEILIRGARRTVSGPRANEGEPILAGHPGTSHTLRLDRDQPVQDEFGYGFSDLPKIGRAKAIGEPALAQGDAAVVIAVHLEHELI